MEVQMKYKWATLGTGVIANELVPGLAGYGRKSLFGSQPYL